MNFLDKFCILLLLFPAYSISALFTGIFVSLRLEFIPLIIKAKGIKLNYDLIVLIAISSLFIPIAYIINNDFLATAKYFLLPLSYIYILIFISNKKLNLFFKRDYFKIAILINFIYCIYQYIVYYSGNKEYAMLHSNIPDGVDYIIPVDLLLRITGLFNENSQFAFFLSIAFVYLKLTNSKLYFLSLLLLILTASKFAFLFLVFYIIINYKYALIFLIPALPLILGEGFTANSLFINMGFSPSNERFEQIGPAINSLSFLGSGKLAGWDVFSYHLGGYGIVLGLSILIVHIKIICKSKLSKDLLLIFFLSFVAHGSMSNLPQTLLLLTALTTRKQQKFNS